MPHPKSRAQLRPRFFRGIPFLAVVSLAALSGAVAWTAFSRTSRSPDLRASTPTPETVPLTTTLVSQHGAHPNASAPLFLAAPFKSAAFQRALRSGNDKVAVGYRGWLFYRQGLEHVSGPGFLSPPFMAARARSGNAYDPRIAMRDWHAQLQKRGIKLVLLPVPDKATLYPEQVAPGYHGLPPCNASFARWKREMEATGVPVFDPTPALVRAKASSKELLYLPRDSHWTPYGAQVCAQALAQWLPRAASLPSLPPILYHPLQSQVSASADLTRMIKLASSSSSGTTAVPNVPVPTVPVRNIFSPQGGPTPDISRADVLILGDSYAGQYASMHAGLANQLSYELKRQVACLAVPNGGSWATRFRLRDDMRKGQDLLKGKKLVIWEFTARDLSSGVWKVCTLPQAGVPQKAVPKLTKPPTPASPISASHILHEHR